MTTEIEMRAQAAVQIAAQDDRFFAHIARDEIPGMGNLAFMTKIEPAAREHPLAFQLIDLPVGENAPVDEPSFRVDERFYFHPTPPSVRELYSADYSSRRKLSSRSQYPSLGVLRPALIRCKN